MQRQTQNLHKQVYEDGKMDQSNQSSSLSNYVILFKIGKKLNSTKVTGTHNQYDVVD